MCCFCCCFFGFVSMTLHFRNIYGQANGVCECIWCEQCPSSNRVLPHKIYQKCNCPPGCHCSIVATGNNCFTFDGFWESFNYFVVVSNDSFIAPISCACASVWVYQMQLSNFLLNPNCVAQIFIYQVLVTFPSLLLRGVQKAWLPHLKSNNWHTVTPQTTLWLQQTKS